LKVKLDSGSLIETQRGGENSLKRQFERQSRGVVLPSLKDIYNQSLPMDRKMKSGIMNVNRPKRPEQQAQPLQPPHTLHWRSDSFNIAAASAIERSHMRAVAGPR
jgi:hypothetical protein